jgi:hypothetical protein
MKLRLILACAICCFAARARGQTTPEFKVPRAVVSPRIDGDLSDEAWQIPPLELSEWLSYGPVRGEKMPDPIDVRMTYDDRYLYVAFHCVDADPTRVRTTLRRRDDAFNDDWVGLSLDSAGTGQSAYHLFVNPSGVQMDAVNTAAAGERFDTDLVWDSVGRLTPDGYVVELAVPLQTIRFKGGRDVRMGILFWRHVAQSGMSYSSPAMPPGEWVFNRHAHIVFDSLSERRLVELLPTATLPVSQTRATPDRWNPADAKPDVGLSAKLGITANVTLDSTINPDFSQVESDAFQALVNQRFPVFFPEKRPFFMEGSGLFSLAGTGDGNMRSSVHTRRIVDPGWGTKVTGNQGDLSFGVLSANDDTPEDVGNRGSAVDGRKKLFTVGRATYGIGAGSYVGGIFTDTEHAGRRNRVTGADVLAKVTSEQQVTATFLHTATAVSGADANGDSATATYSFNSHRFDVNARAEHYDRNFQMDTAFLNRTGFSSASSYGAVNFYPQTARRLGIISMGPFLYTEAGRDRVQNGDERTLTTGLKFNTTRQGFLQVDYQHAREPWVGQRFDNGHLFNSFGGIQLYQWLHLFGAYQVGRSPYYDPVAPYQGKTRTSSASFTLQANAHISQDIGWDTVRFDRADTGLRVFTVNIVNSKSVYQFDKHFLVRLLEQYDSSSERLLTDFLASYEVVPGTVFFAGYGSLYEREGLVGGVLVPNTGNYLTVSRGLFFKASFLHRF